MIFYYFIAFLLQNGPLPAGVVSMENWIRLRIDMPNIFVIFQDFLLIFFSLRSSILYFRGGVWKC